MKSKLLGIVCVFASLSGFCQSKKDSIPPSEKEYSIKLPFRDWQMIFQLVASADNMSAKEASALNQQIANQINVQTAAEPAKKPEPSKK